MGYIVVANPLERFPGRAMPVAIEVDRLLIVICCRTQDPC